ncbi:structural toxin protein [Rutstroemia sp. NJR-2017a WRK4]|nr:structural toxin protein [Rutstroemia sp. NJR-2017a WRK4]
MASTSTALTRYRLSYTVPPTHLQATKDAVFAVGAGVYPPGKYVQCAFEIPGRGQFLPVAEAGADPHTGQPGKLEYTEETKVEILCVGEDVARKSVDALKSAHPYEEVAYAVFKMEDF